jgi:hypothetical protein
MQLLLSADQEANSVQDSAMTYPDDRALMGKQLCTHFYRDDIYLPQPTSASIQFWPGNHQMMKESFP